MALWERVQQLNDEALQQVGVLYGDNFSIDVRAALAKWIEDQQWSELDPDNPQHYINIVQLINTFFQELEKTSSDAQDFLLKLKLEVDVEDYKLKYLGNPLELFRIIKHCLQREMRIVQQFENFGRGVNQINFQPDPSQQIGMSLEKLRQTTQETCNEVREMQQNQEDFVILFEENSILKAQLQMTQNSEVIAQLTKEIVGSEKNIKLKVNDLVLVRMKITEQFLLTIHDLNELQKIILDKELIQWKRGQQLFGNGVPFDNNLDQIQEWCEALVYVIWQSRRQIKQMETFINQVPMGDHANLQERLQFANNQITSLLHSLVSSTFIIEKQPPQVMKKNTRFTATVRLLVGSKLSVYLTPPQVKVTIISEAQAIALLKNDKVGQGCGEIQNNTGTMEYHQGTRQLSVTFRNMELSKIKGEGKKGTESVMDEKFSFLFESQFKVGGGELVFQVWTLSLPVVIVHGNQEPHAWATVTWDNAFAEPMNIRCFKADGRVLFQVPEEVSWKEVADMLSTKFKDATGRGLTEDNLHFLASKVFRSSQFQDFSMMVTWSQFCKEPLPDRSFTFWEWFYAIMKVTREHLRNIWNDGHIIGFIGLTTTEEMLFKTCNGTFIIRFSDSELGGVTVAYLTDNPQKDGGREVVMIEPLTSKRLVNKSLVDTLLDLKHLTTLYPDTPKDMAFQKYHTSYSVESLAPANGYMRDMLVTQIIGYDGSTGGFDSFPETPQSAILQSPEPDLNDPHFDMQ